jgi:Zn-dependent protease
LDLQSATIFYVTLLVSLVFHEAAHALAALLGGDRTAYIGGQVTLNPIPHIQREPFGTVLLPVGLLFLSHGTATMGFAHAPVDAIWAHRHPRKAALMSAAGPLSNFLLVFLAALLLKILVMMDLVEVMRSYSPLDLYRPADLSTSGALKATCQIAATFIYINVLLGVLNLIPVPPLDGAGVVEGLFPRSAGRFYRGLRELPGGTLLPMVGVLVLFFNYGSVVLNPPINLVVAFVKG